MFVWLFDARGKSGHLSGVSDDELAAVSAVVPSLYLGTAREAVIEQARLVAGVLSPGAGYDRTGHGWRAEATSSGIRWEPLRDTCATRSDRRAALRKELGDDVHGRDAGDGGARCAGDDMG